MWKYLQVSTLKRHNQYYPFIDDALYPHWILMPAFSESFLNSLLGLKHQASLPITLGLTPGQQSPPHPHAVFCKVTTRNIVWVFILWEFLIFGAFPSSESIQKDKTTPIFSQKELYILYHIPSPYRATKRKWSFGRKAEILFCNKYFNLQRHLRQNTPWSCL